MATKILYQGKVPVPEAIVRVLEEGGFVMVFGISGGKSNYFFNAHPGPSFHD
jgi:thiamine pyrophosphate-dependent acetolactate synthase large subunit-like protein